MTAQSYAHAATPRVTIPNYDDEFDKTTKPTFLHQVRELSQPPPQSLTLTAVLELLEPLEEKQPDVFLMTRSYVQNWLNWAYHQKVAKTESSRVEEGLRLAAGRLGLMTPYLNIEYKDPGPIDASILSMEGHPLLLRPNVTVKDGISNPLFRTQNNLRRVKSCPDESEKKAEYGDIPDQDCLDYEENKLVCCAVPQKFYEVSITLQVRDG